MCTFPHLFIAALQSSGASSQRSQHIHSAWFLPTSHRSSPVHLSSLQRALVSNSPPPFHVTYKSDCLLLLPCPLPCTLLTLVADKHACLYISFNLDSTWEEHVIFSLWLWLFSFFAVEQNFILDTYRFIIFKLIFNGKLGWVKWAQN